MNRTELLTKSQYEIQQWLAGQVDQMIGIASNQYQLPLPDASLVVGIPLLMQGVRCITIASNGHFGKTPDHREVSQKVIELINKEYGLELQFQEGPLPGSNPIVEG